MTRARAAVLAALKEARSPLSARELLAATGAACDLATVYRALDYLEGSGLAESFIMRGPDRCAERYFMPAGSPHRHWLHCESCHRFVDLGACRIGDLESSLERELGLSIHGHSLQFSGLCPGCRKVEDS